MRLGYIASHYPAPSHTFITREVRALRRHGVEVETFSIHRAAPEQLFTAVDQEEGERTFAALPAGPGTLVATHLAAAGRHPMRYVRTVAHALRRARPGAKGRLWGLFYFAEAMLVWREARKRDVRHLHAQFADSATDVALLVSHFGGPGWSWSLAVHGPVEFYDVTLNALEEKVRDARLTVAISHFGRSQLMTVADEESWSRIHVVRCGIEPENFVPNGRATATGTNVLCVGRLVHLKGQSQLITAVAELRGRGQDVRLTLVGDGPKRAELEEQARRAGVEEHVTFTGAIGQEEVREHYRRADIFCLPSMAEGLPVVFMEALALEIPVIATRIMGIPELVEDGETGLLITPGRQDELVVAIERLAADPELRARLGRAGRERVLSEFDVDVSARRLRELFSGALS